MCGCAPEELVRVAELLCANSGRERTSAIVYALGWTQHTTGVQMIRTAGILQLLLGNMGRPGGGIMAMRGHSTIQGSTDLATLYDVLPGYLPQPCADEQHETLDSYVEHEGLPTGYWANFRKFIVSLLKAWYGDAATPENDFRFSWLPRVDADYSQLPYFDRMSKGEVKGYFLFGQNPAGGGPNAGLHRAGPAQPRLAGGARLVRDRERRLLEERPDRPAARRHQDRGVLHPRRRRAGEGGQPHQHPADAPVARQGARPARRQPLRRLVPLQPRQAPQAALRRLDRPQGPAPAPPHLGLRLRPAAATCPTARLSRIEGEPDLEKVLMEINGYRLDETDPRTGRPRLVSGFSELKDDGTTACGCWIYSGVFPEPGRNRARERKRTDNPLAARLGLRLAAQPPHPVQPRLGGPRGPAVVGAQEAGLVGHASSAGGSASTSRTSTPSKPPDYRPPPGATGMAAIAGNQPFIMKPDGVGWLFAPGAVKDGPLPAHYEPVESPVGNLLYPRQTCNPTVRTLRGAAQPAGPHADRGIPGGRHHVPPHRALPERADEPVQQLAQRTAAGDVRRAQPGAGRRARHRPRRLADGALGPRPRSRPARW